MLTVNQLRLFGCRCIRRIWYLLTNKCFQTVVEVVERYINGNATNDELMAATVAADAVRMRLGDEYKKAMAPGHPYTFPGPISAKYAAANAVIALARSIIDKTDIGDINHTIITAVYNVAIASAKADCYVGLDIDYQNAKKAEKAWQAEILRTMFCNPFTL